MNAIIILSLSNTSNSKSNMITCLEKSNTKAKCSKNVDDMRKTYSLKSLDNYVERCQYRNKIIGEYQPMSISPSLLDRQMSRKNEQTKDIKLKKVI